MEFNLTKWGPWVEVEVNKLREGGLSESILLDIEDRIERMSDGDITTEEVRQANIIFERLANFIPVTPITDEDGWVEKEDPELGKYMVSNRSETLIKIPGVDEQSTTYSDISRIVVVDIDTNTPVEDGDKIVAVGMVIDHIAPVVLPYMHQQYIAYIRFVSNTADEYTFDIMEINVDGKPRCASNGRYKCNIAENSMMIANHLMVCDDPSQWREIKDEGSGAIKVEVYHPYPGLRAITYASPEGDITTELVDINRAVIYMEYNPSTEKPEQDVLESIVGDIIHHYYPINGLPYTPSGFRVEVNITSKFGITITKGYRHDDPTDNCELMLGEYEIIIEDDIPSWKRIKTIKPADVDTSTSVENEVINSAT